MKRTCREALSGMILFMLLAFGLPVVIFASGPNPIRPTPSLCFMENKGQVVDQAGQQHPEVLFVAKAKGYTVFIDSAGLHYQFKVQLSGRRPNPGLLGDDLHGLIDEPSEESMYKVHQLDFLPLNLNPNMEIEGIHPLDYRENYYNIPSQPRGIEDVRSYAAIRIRNLYPGIDWLLYWKEGRLKYDFEVSPGADPDQIAIEIKGADAIELDEQGSLVMKTPLGTLTDEAPNAAQLGASVGVSYTISEAVVHYRLEAYDTTQLLTIDPGIEWASYYGGLYTETPLDISVSDSGLIATGGVTDSPNLISYGNFPSTLGGLDDGFVLVIDSNGTPLWGTYVGGTGNETIYSVAFDHLGGLLACGSTESATGIATPGSLQTTRSGVADAMLLRFGLNGSLIWGTYFGGAQLDGAVALALSDSNEIYMAGGTEGVIPLLPVGGGFQQAFAGGVRDVFVAKFTINGALTWGTNYGGTGGEASNSLAIDDAGNLFLGGTTTSQSGIAYQGFQSSFAGVSDAFVVKFSPTGNRIFATYYGGPGQDQSLDLAIDSHANFYITGWTRSTSGITYNGYQMTTPVQPNLGSAFLIKFDSMGNRIWGTYYNGTIPSFGSFYSNGIGLAVDEQDGVYFVGRIRALDGMADHGFQMFPGGYDDGFVAKFDSNGSRVWGSFWGGGAYDNLSKVATYKSDWIAVCGEAWSQNLAINGFQSTHLGLYSDAMIMRIGLHCDAPPVATCRNATVTLSGGQALVPVSIIDSSSYSSCNHYSTKAVDPSVFSCAQVGLQPVLFTITDGNGIDSCYATVLVRDVTAPTMVCPGNLTAYTPNQQCSAVSNYALPSATDNCGISSLVLTSGLPSGGTFPIGITNNLYQATDASGNSATCSFSVNVVDGQFPTITCPPNLTICAGNYNYSLPTAIDNCPGVTLSLVSGLNVGDYFPVGYNYVTWRATDLAGYSSTCTFYIRGLPPLQPVNQVFTICDGASFQVGNHSYTAPGLYSDTLVSLLGCDSIVNTNLSVLPPINTTVQTNMATISAQLAGAAYQWLDCDQNWQAIPSANAQSFTATTSGNYAVEIRVIACKDTSSCVNISLTAMTESIVEFVEVFPNPTKGVFAVRFRSAPESADLRLFDCAGKLLEEHSLSAIEFFEIDLSERSKGIYLLQIDASIGRKFIRVERW